MQPWKPTRVGLGTVATMHDLVQLLYLIEAKSQELPKRSHAKLCEADQGELLANTLLHRAGGRSSSRGVTSLGRTSR